MVKNEQNIPVDGAAHVERGKGLDKEIQMAQERRREMLAKRPVEGHPMTPRREKPR
jgi:hypothetical protein